MSDMTAFWAAGRHWELALFVDLWNDETVGWSVSPKKGDPAGYYEGLAGFLGGKRCMGLEAAFHADRGAAYSSRGFSELLQPYDTARSMSRAGTPTDNAATESINGWAKSEMSVDSGIDDSDDAGKTVGEYVRFSDKPRPTCCLGHMTPVQYRACPRIAGGPNTAPSRLST